MHACMHKSTPQPLPKHPRQRTAATQRTLERRVVDPVAHPTKDLAEQPALDPRPARVQAGRVGGGGGHAAAAAAADEVAERAPEDAAGVGAEGGDLAGAERQEGRGRHGERGGGAHLANLLWFLCGSGRGRSVHSKQIVLDLCEYVSDPDDVFDLKT